MAGTKKSQTDSAAVADESTGAADKPKTDAKKAATGTKTAAKKTTSGTTKSTASKSTGGTKSTASKSGTASKKTDGATEKKSTTTAAKKPAAKKPAADKTADDAITEEKPVAKKPTGAKKTDSEPDTVDEVKAADEPVVEEKVEEEPVIEEKLDEPVVEEKTEEPKAEAPAPDDDKKDEPVEAKADDKTDEPATDDKKDEPAAEAAAAADAAVAPAKSKTEKFAGKSSDFIKGKGKLPIFIIINALFAVSAILLMFCAYTDKSGNYTIFQYYSSPNMVKKYLMLQAGQWVDGARTMLGILMMIAMLVPLALVVKNIIILATKKDKSVYTYDSIIFFAAMLFYVSMVNVFGAYISAGQMIALIGALVIFLFTMFLSFISDAAKGIPFFSIFNVVLAFIAAFTLTWSVFRSADGVHSWAVAAAADAIGGAGGALFVMTFITICALVVLVIMQVHRLPKIVEIGVPLIAAVFALISLIIAGSNIPDALNMSGGYIFGFVLTVIIAIADTLFAFLKPLQKYKVQAHGN